MMNEYYGAPSTPNDDFLAHYGVKGMKWGVRRALAKGSDRALGRQYRKAQKKLAKLEKLGANGKKYAKRAAAYGAGAAAAGGLAAAGTGGISTAMNGLGKGIHRFNYTTAAKKLPYKVRAALNTTGTALKSAGGAVGDWGSTKTGLKMPGISDVHNFATKHGFTNKVRGTAVSAYDKTGLARKELSNNTLARVGAGAVGVGLGAAAARNAYRAATAKKHAAQAQQFRKEMNKAFAGTKYANGAPAKSKKRRRG